jgi:hypothetical protein
VRAGHAIIVERGVMTEASMGEREHCTVCGADVLSVLYYGAEGEPVGGYSVCSNCGPRNVVEVTTAADIRRNLLERKAS